MDDIIHKRGLTYMGAILGPKISLCPCVILFYYWDFYYKLLSIRFRVISLSLSKFPGVRSFVMSLRSAGALTSAAPGEVVPSQLLYLQGT